ncbi:hypothetical protein [Terricaulis sp.]|uniref:hypothetical protein n=1 Tax=Terricaulis sp. TaxID=2768686 RepID=UPI0037843B84
MTLEQISYLSQTIAAVAVIASLVFVGVQIRQSEKSQRAVMHDNRLRVLRETALHISLPGVTESYIKGSNGDPDITQTEWTQFLFVMAVQDITRDEQYRQYREGLISAERWRQSQATIMSSMTLPGYRAIYHINRPFFSVEYQALLDGMLKDIMPTDPDWRFEAWKSLAAAERARIGGAAPAAAAAREAQ